jgi:vacuolar protein sorting-associated protein 33A
LINNLPIAYVELPANIVSPPAPAASTSTVPALATTPIQAEKKKYQLSSSSDPLFGELRDVNFAVLGGLLSTTAKRLSSDYEVWSYDKL